MKSKITILLWLLVAISFATKADMLNDAATAYDKGDYQKAVELYNQVAKEQGTSSSLLFDMGQAYMRAGNLGQAMLCYQRSLRLDPSNEEEINNVAYIESRVQDANRAELKDKKIQITGDDPSFFTTMKHFITRRHVSDTWAIWSGVTFVLFCGCVALYIFSQNILARKIGFFGGGAMIALSIIFILFAITAANASQKHDEGVITAYKTTLYTDPSTSSKNVGTTLTHGTVMQVIDTEDGENGKPEWYKVRLNSDIAGWIRMDSFETI